MQSKAKTVQEYLDEIPDERKDSFSKLRKTIQANLPKGFVEGIGYGMIGYTVPFNLYPKGYHCASKLPLPFVNLASQKNFIAFYHMGLYGNPKLLAWFVKEYPKHSKYKLDMGKSCVRFKKIDGIPYKLLGELMKKISVEEWISWYEKIIIKAK